MKKILFSLLVLFQGLAPLEARSFSHSIEENRPLQELLSLFDISIENAVSETQKQWLQKGKERWEFDRRFEEMRPKLWPLFEKLGLLDEIEPEQTSYDYALVLGSLLGTMENRVGYLSTLHKKGICFGQIVFLTGDRDLLETEKAECRVSTETEMARWVYEKSDLPRDIPVVFIHAEKKQIEGKWVRPQTSDTVLEWMKQEPKTGSCLAISNQPYVSYQDAVLRKLLCQKEKGDSQFSLETVGKAPQNPPSIALLLDTIAKDLYWSKSN